MPKPTENTEPTTVEEFIAGAEEWGDTEIFSEEQLRDFCQRMIDASGDFETRLTANASKSSKITINVYHPSYDKAAKMADILAGGFRACNGLLNEVCRQRAQLRMLNAERAEMRELRKDEER